MKQTRSPKRSAVTMPTVNGDTDLVRLYCSTSPSSNRPVKKAPAISAT